MSGFGQERKSRMRWNDPNPTLRNAPVVKIFQGQCIPSNLIKNAYCVSIPASCLSPSFTTLREYDSSSTEATIAIGNLMFLVSAIERKLRFCNNSNNTGRPPGRPKAKPKAGKKKNQPNADGNDNDDDDEGESEGEDNTEIEESMPVDKEDLDGPNLFTKKSEVIDLKDEVEYSDVKEELPRVFCVVDWYGKQTKTAYERPFSIQEYMQYSNLVCLMFTFYVIDPKFNVESAINSQLRFNEHICRTSGVRPIHRLQDSIRSKETLRGRLLYNNAVKSDNAPADFMAQLQLACCLDRFRTSIDPSLLPQKRYSENRAFEKSDFPFLRWDIPVNDITVEHFCSMRFPWVRLIQEAMPIPREVQILSEREREGKALLDIEGVVTAAVAETEELQKHILRDYFEKTFESTALDDNEAEKHFAGPSLGDEYEYKEQSEKYKELIRNIRTAGLNKFNQEWSSSNINIPKTYRLSWWNYVSLLKAEGKKIIPVKPLSKDLSAFSEYMIKYIIAAESMGLGDFGVFLLHRIMGSAWSIYHLRTSNNTPEHLMIQMPPGCGKSHTLKEVKESLLGFTYQDIGSFSNIRLNNALEPARAIFLSDEASRILNGTDDSKTDLGPLLSRLTGSSARSTQVRDEKTGNYTPVDMAVDARELWVMLTNEMGESKIGSSGKQALRDRFNSYSPNYPKKISGRVSTPSLALYSGDSQKKTFSNNAKEWLKYMQSWMMYWTPNVANRIVPPLPEMFAADMINKVFQSSDFFDFGTREITRILNQVVRLQHEFAIHYVTHILHPNEFKHELYRPEIAQEIAKCAIGRTEIVIFELSEALYNHLNGGWDEILRSLARNFANYSSSIISRGDKFPNFATVYETGPKSVKKQEFEKNQLYYLDSITNILEHSTAPNSASILYSPLFSRVSNGDGGTKPHWDYQQYELGKRGKNCYVIDPRFRNKILEETEKETNEIAFPTVSHDGQRCIDPNYIVIQIGISLTELRSSSASSKNAGAPSGDTYDMEKVRKVVKELSKKTMCVPVLPLILERAKIARNPRWIQSLHYNEKLSGESAPAYNMKIVRPCQGGFWVLAKYIEMSTETVITQTLSELCYNKTRETTSLLSLPDSKYPIAYSKYTPKRRKGEALVIPPQTNLTETTLNLADSMFSDSPPDETTRNYTNKSRPVTYRETDIEQQRAFEYYARHWPEEDPFEIWSRYSPAAVERKFNELRREQGMINANYPEFLFHAEQDPKRALEPESAENTAKKRRVDKGKDKVLDQEEYLSDFRNSENRSNSFEKQHKKGEIPPSFTFFQRRKFN